MELLSKARLINDVLHAPRVTIDCFGDDFSHWTYLRLNKRHPRVPVIRFKTFGVMLRRIDESFGGGKYRRLRSSMLAAERLGYTTREIVPGEHFSEIMGVNRSSEVRQGRAISDDYINEKKVALYNQRPGRWFGVFDKTGVLRAYCHTPILGDYFLFSRLLGDASRLEDGVMYLMIRDVMLAMQKHHAKHGYPTWAIYDTYIGGGSGLREFKRRLGFAPARVTWRWLGAARND